LKIGLNEGHVLAINANERLDYFGQMVNIAARVQGLADADEIWFTDEIYRSSGVRELISEFNYRVSEHEVELKGIGSPVKVFKMNLKNNT
jgi:class 3 adenylate cyclase